MDILELEEENKLKQTDITNFSKIVYHAIDVKKIGGGEKKLSFKLSIVDLLSNMLETTLISNIDISKEEKITAINLLSKLKANKEYLNFVKNNLIDGDKSIINLYSASSRMSKKTQSAFSETIK